ncbi:MAG: hypothetical protein MJK12_17710 [Colwellia sp.]|nr:hypothetical protein [Colwellia sp.]
MLKILFITLSFLLTACSTQVHLITEGYSTNKVNLLKQQLIEKGYRVKVLNITIPVEFPNSVIAINPSYQNFSAINELSLLLESLAFSTAVERRFGQGHHFYTANNIGLYLRNPEVNSANSMPPYLRTQYCKKGDANLEFRKNGEFTLETESYVNDDYVLDTLPGKWWLANRVLTLTLDNGTTAKFIKDQQQVETYQGMKPADVFLPSKENAELKQLSCKFIIIYMG